MTKTLVSILFTGLLSMGAANADERDKSADTEATFKSLDRDADERLSKTEASGDRMLSTQFAAVDKDSDGYLTKREYTAHMKSTTDKPKKDY